MSLQRHPEGPCIANELEYLSIANETETYTKLLARLKQVNDIQGSAGLLGWD